MAWIFALVGLLLVFAIAAAFVGSEAFKLGHETPAAIFDVDEAVEVVGERLPVETQAHVTYDEVRHLVLATLDHLRAKGLGALPGEAIIGPPEDVPAVVVADDDAVAVVLGAIDAQALDVADEDAYEVIRALLGYLAHIGALGPRA